MLLSAIYLYNSFALFTEEKHFNAINGTVQDPGDIYFAYYVNDGITRELPKQNTGYTLDTEKSNCTNGVKVNWDNKNWTALVNYQEYNATDYTRTRCNLYFKKTAVLNILDLAKTDTTNLAVDDYGNTRYIGANPNNYVSIDGELWRIIGVMKDIDDGTGIKEDRIKLIRNESIGNYSWDTSASSTNNGYGINEWSQAKLMKLLNPGYESESVGGSLYWNSSSGTCYNSTNNSTTSCDFTNIGIKDKLKSLISDAVWNTGTNGTNDYKSSSNGLASYFYTYERSNNTGKICTTSTGGTGCNDAMERTSIWTGKIGLMYPSDYGYATSGGSTSDRATCMNTAMYSWSSYKECTGNNWLFNGSDQWTLMSYASSYYAYVSFRIGSAGDLFTIDARYAITVRPVVYLLSNVLITSGDGSESNPYTLSV